MKILIKNANLISMSNKMDKILFNKKQYEY